VNRVLEHRIKLATENFTGKLITSNFKKIVSILAPYKIGEKVLDIGSGWGLLQYFLPKHVKRYALDISPNALTISSTLYKGAERIISDACMTSFKDDTFDKIFCINLIAHLPSMENGLNEIHRIIKPKGLCVVNFTNRYGLVNLPRTVLKLRIGYYARYSLFAPIDKSCSYSEIKKIFKLTGFKILENYGWGISVPYSIGKKVPRIAEK